MFSYLIWTFIAVKFPLSTEKHSSYLTCYILIMLNSKYFKFPLLFYSLAQGLFKNMWFNFKIFGFFIDILRFFLFAMINDMAMNRIIRTENFVYYRSYVKWNLWVKRNAYMKCLQYVVKSSLEKIIPIHDPFQMNMSNFSLIFFQSFTFSLFPHQSWLLLNDNIFANLISE